MIYRLIFTLLFNGIFLVLAAPRAQQERSESAFKFPFSFDLSNSPLSKLPFVGGATKVANDVIKKGESIGKETIEKVKQSKIPIVSTAVGVTGDIFSDGPINAAQKAIEKVKQSKIPIVSDAVEVTGDIFSNGPINAAQKAIEKVKQSKIPIVSDAAEVAGEVLSDGPINAAQKAIEKVKQSKIPIVSSAAEVAGGVLSDGPINAANKVIDKIQHGDFPLLHVQVSGDIFKNFNKGIKTILEKIGESGIPILNSAAIAVLDVSTLNKIIVMVTSWIRQVQSWLALPTSCQ